MTNKVSVRQFIAPLFISALLVGIAVPVLLPVISGQAQVYEDIILELTSLQNLNKSGELRLLWCLLVVSIAIVILWNYRVAKKQISAHDKKCTWNDKIVFILLVPCFARFLFFSAIDGYMLLVAALAMFLVSCKLLTYRNILLMAVVYFAILGVAAATVPLTATPSPHTQIRLMFLAVFFFAVIMLANRYVCEKTAWLSTLALQVLIPLILLYFLHDQYNLNGKLTKIEFDSGYIYLVKFGVAALVLHSLFRAYAAVVKNRHGAPSLDDLILPTTAVAIFVFNSVNITIPMLRDWHHAAEQFVPFQQVADFGKTLYDDFLSASGLHPMPFGFVQRFLLDNTVASYYQAETLLNIASCTMSGILLNYVFGKKCALFIVLSFVAFWGYTRILPLLPFLLILMVPSIVTNRHLWLQIYVICSMLLGLYYPLYGGAYLISALPFAIVQLRELLRVKQAPDKKYTHIYVWGVVVITVLLFSPLLFRLAGYTIMMSSQTVLADGIPIFSHDATNSFLRWLYNNTVRKILFFCVVYFLQIINVIVPLSICICYLLLNKNSNKYRDISFFAFSFAVIMLPIIYTYSLVRMDYNSFLFRTSPPFSAILIVLFGSLWRYGGAMLTRKVILVCFSCLLTVNSLFLVRPQSHAEKFFRAPTFNAGWQVAPHDIQAHFPRLGSVILQKLDIDRINRTQALLEKLNGISAPLLNLPPGQMSYFLFDKEASVLGTVYPMRSTAAQKNVISIMERNPPICFDMSSFEHYVIYRWILDTDYVISDGIAIPRKIAENMPSTATPDYYSIFWGFTDVRNRANALGKSLHSLMPQFTEQLIPTRTQKTATTITVYFDRNIDGREVDFIFIDLTDGNRPRPPQGFRNFLKNYFEVDDRQYKYATSYKKYSPPRLRVRASWTGENGVFDKKKTMEMAFGNGKLLMPLGANPWWLTGETKTLKLEIYGNIAEGESFSLNEIKLLQFKPTAQYAIDPALPKAHDEVRAESE